MIEVFDRIPTYPGRVKMTPVAGLANTYDMVRADEPIEAGTPINRALFERINDEFSAMRKSTNAAIFAASQQVDLALVALGTEIGLYENGVLTPFILLARNYVSSGRSLLVRKHCYNMAPMMNAGEDVYDNCRIDKWLNEEYLGYLAPATQAVISGVSIRSGSAADLIYLNRKVFLLSTVEYDLDPINGRYEGTSLSYFDSSAKRICRYEGAPVIHYTRTVHSSYGNNDTNAITENGTVVQITDPVNTLCGIRPAFTLPNSVDVLVAVPDTGNTMATAEVI